MNKKTKIILSFVGIAAVVVPALLLMLASSNAKKAPAIDSSTRQIDQINLGGNKNVSPTPLSSPVTVTPPPVNGGFESTPASR